MPYKNTDPAIPNPANASLGIQDVSIPGRIRQWGGLVHINWNYWIRRRTVVPYAPYRLWIEPTNRCNLTCVMCPNRNFGKDALGRMDFRLYRKVIDEASGFVHDVNLHHRGEPTLHEQLPDMIRYAKAAGVRVKLHTNATTLTPRLAETLIESGLDLISFSFDGYSAETYEAVRRGSRFEETRNRIHGFLELKKGKGSRRPKTVIEVMELRPGHVRSHEKEEFIRGMKSRGLDRFIVKRPHNWGGELALDAPATDRFSPCTFPWHALVVLWDGRTGPCPHDFFGRIALGDANGQGLRELFNGTEMQRLRARMMERSFNAQQAPCRSCDSIRRKRLLGIPMESLKYLNE